MINIINKTEVKECQTEKPKMVLIRNYTALVNPVRIIIIFF